MPSAFYSQKKSFSPPQILHVLHLVFAPFLNKNLLPPVSMISLMPPYSELGTFRVTFIDFHYHAKIAKAKTGRLTLAFFSTDAVRMMTLILHMAAT